MKKVYGCLILALAFFFLGTTGAHASFVTVDSQGEIIWNVLASEDGFGLGVDSTRQLDVTDSVGGADEIALTRQEDKLFLNDIDVTDLQDDLVEIEERQDVKKITISSKDNKFNIKQDGIEAETDYPIYINAKDNELSVKTDAGKVFLAVLPREAAESALRSRFINRIPENKIYINDHELGVLSYEVRGQKVLSILNVIEQPIDVTAYVSASTGEILDVSGPEWFKVFAFLFS